ncbi:aldolase/citrate lyase family protein [Tibeticola sp.]|uniref:aldolase/citrate lyase family protein n=1 Tax=Tibeticola sp. TaxID=2005368 RepID=UPI0025D3F42F|nr:aldolase/citrate lyase family protein [Tibeticola sp.]
MIELLQITADPAFARRCAALPGLRLFVDLERHGKAERQAGRNSFISTHTLADVAAVRAAAPCAPLMVRLNPLHAGTAAEIDAALAQGADRLMLPMFDGAEAVATFCALVAGRVPVTALLETRGALETVARWAGTPGLDEIYVGLNDLHLSLGLRFMFEPLALGLLDRVAAVARAHGRRLGFGGIARVEEGLLSGRDVLAEHLRLGSQAVILSRTFQRSDAPEPFEAAVAALRAAESELAQRSAAEVEADRLRIAAQIRAIAERLPASASAPAAPAQPAGGGRA